MRSLVRFARKSRIRAPAARARPQPSGRPGAGPGPRAPGPPPGHPVMLFNPESGSSGAWIEGFLHLEAHAARSGWVMLYVTSTSPRCAPRHNRVKSGLIGPVPITGPITSFRLGDRIGLEVPFRQGFTGFHNQALSNAPPSESFFDAALPDQSMTRTYCAKSAAGRVQIPPARRPFCRPGIRENSFAPRNRNIRRREVLNTHAFAVRKKRRNLEPTASTTPAFSWP